MEEFIKWRRLKAVGDDVRWEAWGLGNQGTEEDAK